MPYVLQRRGGVRELPRAYLATFIGFILFNYYVTFVRPDEVQVITDYIACSGIIVSAVILPSPVIFRSELPI